VFVFAGFADVLARIAPVASAVAIVHIVFKLITYAIGDKDRWRRLMFVMMPLLAVIMTVVLALTAVAVWWLVADGGVHVLLNDIGAASTAQARSGPR
jgi:hypothetical protein